ncbi:MAG: alpha/beta hydrolase [Solirubrobacteraceae bacterium]
MDVTRQLADWRAAIDHARSLPNVDPNRIALWGSSLAGGHVVDVAASDPALAAVISQVPFSGLGGARGATPRRPTHLARMVGAALLDAAAARLRRGPRYLPVVSQPGHGGAFDRPGAVEQIAALVEGDPTWVNRFTPRVLLELARYRPFARGVEVRCPVLLTVCDRDDVTPAAPAVRRAARISRLTVEHHDCGHFDIYQGAAFERAIKSQIAFLGEHLG